MTVIPGGTDGHGHSLGEDKQDSVKWIFIATTESVGLGLALGGKDHQGEGLGRDSGCPSVARSARQTQISNLDWGWGWGGRAVVQQPDTEGTSASHRGN